MTEDDLDACLASLQGLMEGASQLGLPLDRSRATAFARYCSLIIDGNRRANLTGLKEAPGIMRSLFLDSITIAAAVPSTLLESRQTVVDVGSGAGIPGIPLGLLFPLWQVILVESIGKKARFLREALRTLGLETAVVLEGRAEEFARGKPWRDSADLATARAVAPLSALIELCAPFVKPDGLLSFPKSGGIEVEIAAAAQAARALRVEFCSVVPVPIDLGLGERRATVLYRKVAETPPGYPRRTGIAQSRPIESKSRTPRQAPGQKVQISLNRSSSPSSGTDTARRR